MFTLDVMMFYRKRQRRKCVWPLKSCQRNGKRFLPHSTHLYIYFYLSQIRFIQLDDKIIRRSSTGVARMAPGSSFLSVPPGMDIFTNKDPTDLSQLHHHNIPENTKVNKYIALIYMVVVILYFAFYFSWNT